MSGQQAPPLRRRRSIYGHEGAAGWAFVTPMIVVLGLFLLAPVVMALWVSFTNWTGRGTPLDTSYWVGLDNYKKILLGPGLPAKNFGTSIRNNSYYVLLVVPLQTIISLVLAVLVNRRILKGRGFFRTAFYFPSVTSSVAITVVFMFLFSATGAINKMLAALSVDGPLWFSDPRGLIHVILGNLGVATGPAGLTGHGFLGISWWDWLAGPSAALGVFIMMAIFTTSGTFMLIFLSALQNISEDIEEAAIVDGANGWQRFSRITVPMLRPTLFTVITLGLIGTWQVFDWVYTGTRGGPGNTTLMPAYLSYQDSFINFKWGQGAAVAFLLFVIIIVMTLIQRLVLRERDLPPKRKRFYPAGPPAGSESSTAEAQR